MYFGDPAIYIAPTTMTDQLTDDDLPISTFVSFQDVFYDTTCSIPFAPQTIDSYTMKTGD